MYVVATAPAVCRDADNTITGDLFCNFNFTILVFRLPRVCTVVCAKRWMWTGTRGEF